MKTINQNLQIPPMTYPLGKLGDEDKLLFVDIETTGLSPDYSFIYLIGCAYIDGEEFKLVQYLAEKEEEEEQVIYSFFNFARDYTTLIHYNGNRFDIPFIQTRCDKLQLPYDLRSFDGIDLYRRLKPYKNFLKLLNMKQKDLEEFMGIIREDVFSGGELIEVYKEYAETHDTELESALLLHNSNDVTGLISIVPLLAVSDMFNERLKVRKAGRSPYKDAHGNTWYEIVMDISLPSPLPVKVSYGWSDCYFMGEGEWGKLRVSIYDGELKFFYPNYKEYYYIPAEDIAVHKSVAGFMDSSERETAKASNCYTKKTAMFLPEWEPLFSPVFRESYNEPTMYFELTDEFKRDPKKFSAYAAHLLATLAHPE